jgi:hypothetical protein
VIVSGAACQVVGIATAPEAMRTSLGFGAGDGLELTVGVADAVALGIGDACASKTLSAATAIMLPAPE